MWHERMLDDPSGATVRAFEAWRAAGAEHDEAYESVRAAHDRAAALAADPALLALRHETLARATLSARPRRRIGGKAIAAALLFCAGAPLAAWGIRALTPPPETRPAGETFHTGIGQRADVTLPDGSVVTLDTASRLHVLFDDRQRKVALDGQAWFDLKPSAKPFVIAANGIDMTADTGTFDVRADRGLVRAFSVDGALSMAGVAQPGGTVAATPGDLLAIQGGQVSIRRLADPATFTGWHDGMLQFDNVPVMAAADELNRYRRQPIRIADGRVANMRISGAFRTAETPAFVDALTTGFPVRVRRDDKTGIVIAAR